MAHVLVSKYADHLPLYRQAQIYARQGIDVEGAPDGEWASQRSRFSAAVAVAREAMLGT